MPPKRDASTSPGPVPHPDAKRLPLPDQWSKDEHRLQDEIVKQLSGKASRPRPREYDINNTQSMALLLTIVRQVASESPQPHLFRVLSPEHYVDALETCWRILYEQLLQSCPLSWCVILHTDSKQQPQFLSPRPPPGDIGFSISAKSNAWLGGGYERQQTSLIPLADGPGAFPY
jgi:hypothetical protein